jgi:site-specific DNA recombinase
MGARQRWDKVQAQFAASAAKAKDCNPRSAHGSTYVLSGLLECGLCGQPYIVISTSSGGLYGCRGKRNGTCPKTQTIRRTRIEERVFAALTPSLLSAEHEAAFADAMADEMKRRRGKDHQGEIRDFEKQTRRAEKARRGILAAIEDGASYGSVKARFEEIEAVMADLETRLAATRADAARADTPPPDIRVAFTRALRHVHEWLSDPDLVLEAHELLATLISRIRLTPDDLAPQGIAAEIETDLGRFLLTDPDPQQDAAANRFVTIASLLTAKHRPRTRWPARNECYGPSEFEPFVPAPQHAMCQPTEWLPR